MMDIEKNILDLSNTEARSFFLKKNSFCNLDLPEYLDFQPLINSLSSIIGTKNYKEVRYNHGLSKIEKDPSKEPSNIEGINYRLYHNKDGKYTWRPFEIIHPAMYICLTNSITEDSNWQYILNRVNTIQSDYPQIECESWPLVNDSNPVESKKKILHWWSRIEQRSIELSLKYNYLLNTDITNCYGSIYSHSIVWALHDRKVVKEDIRKYYGVGSDIDVAIQAMSNGQTNGIPQGSTLMDFVAEIVLTYADKLLGEKLLGIVNEYKILRYRDDYRIFTKTREDAELIGKYLSDVLGILNFRLNPHKTFLTDNIVADSIKRDKWYWIQAKHGSDTLQKQLLIIHSLSNAYPNSGSLRRALSEFYLRVGHMKTIKESVRPLIGIIVDIARKNPSVYPIVASILGRFFQEIEDKSELRECINDIKSKFVLIPNTGYLFLWLQRISLLIDDSIMYEEPLCHLVSGATITLWNSSWLKKEYQEVIESMRCVDIDCIDSLPALVPPSLVTLKSDWES